MAVKLTTISGLIKIEGLYASGPVYVSVTKGNLSKTSTNYSIYDSNLSQDHKIGVSTDILNGDDSDTPFADDAALETFVGDFFLNASAGAGASLGVDWTFIANTTDSDPGDKKYKFNNATQANTTEAYISKISESGADIGNVLLGLKADDRIYFQALNDDSKFHVGKVTGTPTDATTYVKIPVIIEDSGADLSNNQKCGLLFFFTGASGGGLTVQTVASAFTAVRASTPQGSIATLTPTNLIYNSEEYDRSNEYNNPTGIFTPATAGLYTVCGGAQISHNPGGSIKLRIIKNGITTIKETEIFPSTAGSTPINVGCTFELSIGDTINLQLFQVTGQPCQMINTENSRFSITKIGD